MEEVTLGDELIGEDFEAQEGAPSCVSAIDGFLRNEDTFLARFVRSLSSDTGQEYLNGGLKRIFDLSLAVPAAVLATPLIFSLAIAKKMEDGGTMFFSQDRLMPSGEEDFSLLKIRCMRQGSDRGADNTQISRGLAAHRDPRNTRLGMFMRKYQLEELPQLYQVISRKVSLIGIRPAPRYVFDSVRGDWSSKRYDSWVDAYSKGSGGITGLNQALNLSEKDDSTRYHLDVFYARNASLGLDLYILWRTIGRLLRLS